jgi:cation transport protein ChaC
MRRFRDDSRNTSAEKWGAGSPLAQTLALSWDMDSLTDPAAGDLWVFGYGALILAAGFPFVERLEARLIGAHRALSSIPSCRGTRAARPGARPRPRRHLPRPPQVAAVITATVMIPARPRASYRSLSRTLRRVWLQRTPAEAVSALCSFIAPIRSMPAARARAALHSVRRAAANPANRDYVIATVAAARARAARGRVAHLATAQGCRGVRAGGADTTRA